MDARWKSGEIQNLFCRFSMLSCKTAAIDKKSNSRNLSYRLRFAFLVLNHVWEINNDVCLPLYLIKGSLKLHQFDWSYLSRKSAFNNNIFSRGIKTTWERFDFNFNLNTFTVYFVIFERWWLLWKMTSENDYELILLALIRKILMFES